MTAAPAPTGLPIEDVVTPIRDALADPGAAVVVAEPGAGKTTVVPLRLLDESWNTGRILVLEPRRVAARAVARRMAWLLGEEVGDTVGWRTRDDRRIGPDTRIEVVTEGILTRRIQGDPSLPGVSAVVFDEFHERSVHADVGLAFALEAREELRPDLRVLVMSATIDGPTVADLLGGEAGPVPLIESEGRTYPVEIRWHPRSRSDRLEPAAARAAVELLADGDVLVFMPGIGEIRRTVGELERMTDALVLPLHGSLDAAEQDQALRSVAGQRRIVVATDVAETSLTVDGIAGVVDSGRARRPRYDPATGLSGLVTIDTSKASADQRAGRAGRLADGTAVRLWSKMEHAARTRHDRPEIEQIDLAGVVLEALAWGVSDPGELRLLDQPPRAAVEEAFEVLAMLHAVDADRRISAAGRAMLSLPLHPRLAAMAAAVGDGPLGWPAAILATLLTEPDVIGGRPHERPPDLWTRVQLVVDNGVSHPDARMSAVRAVRRRAHDLRRRIGADETIVSPDDLGRSLAYAYPDRIAAKRAGQGGRFRLRNGMGAVIDVSEPLAHEDMLVVAELTGQRRDARIARAAAIDPLDVELGFGPDVDERRFLGWDDRRDDLVCRIERRLGALDLGTHESPVPGGDETLDALLERIVATKLGVLVPSDAARTLQARMALARAHGHLLDAPPIDDDTLVDEASEVFAPWLTDARGRSDLEALDLPAILDARLGWVATRTLDRLAPSRWRTPRGRTVPIDYLAETPRVAVRVQELYGTREGPSVLDGSVPLTLELLSPADRPIQITADLDGFWSGSWAEVRREMAGRYPKHDWPKDPVSGS